GGGGRGTEARVGGKIKSRLGRPPAVLPQSTAGRIRLLAVSEEKRFAHLPDVPTIAETVPGVTLPATWLGLLAPAGTPKRIIDKPHAPMLAALAEPHVVHKPQPPAPPR